MLKWQVNSAVGRGRPTVREIQRVTEGIESSLRAFSISARRAADEDGSDPPPSRRERSASAAQEISSLSGTSNYKPVGIDARSLGAKPPPRRVGTIEAGQGVGRFRRTPSGPPRDPRNSSNKTLSQQKGEGGFTITRYDAGTASDASFEGQRRDLRMSGEAKRGARDTGRARAGGRGGRGGAMRGRGGARGRGGSKANRSAKPGDEEAEDEYTEKEIEWMNDDAGGGTHAYVPETSLENLQRWRPATVNSDSGVMENVRYLLAVATENQHPMYRHSWDHLLRVQRGMGTLFEDPKQREILQAWKDTVDQDRAKEFDKRWKQEKFGELTQVQKDKMQELWVAGQYEAPVAPLEEHDALTHVKSYMSRNETYLAGDKKKMLAKINELLPAHLLDSQPSNRARR